MSWYVKALITNSKNIRGNIYQYDPDNITEALENDDYNNLLLLEKKIEGLHKDGYLSDKDIKIITAFTNGKSLVRIAKDLGLYKQTVPLLFNNICNKISYILGGIYTDEGYIQFIQRKHNLSEENVEILRNYMIGDSTNEKITMHSSPHHRRAS